MLLRAGAEPDALADMYEGRYPTLAMLVSSGHPAKAGLQIALAETLLDFGAALEGAGDGAWASPLMTALAFGYQRRQRPSRGVAPASTLSARRRDSAFWTMSVACCRPHPRRIVIARWRWPRSTAE